jgi:hypothetical protein
VVLVAVLGQPAKRVALETAAEMLAVQWLQMELLVLAAVVVVLVRQVQTQLGLGPQAQLEAQEALGING